MVDIKEFEEILFDRFQDFIDKYPDTTIAIKTFVRNPNVILKNRKIDVYIHPFKQLELIENNPNALKEMIEYFDFIKSYFNIKEYYYDYSYCPYGSCFPVKFRFKV